jgi:hypothetical protein
VHQSWFIRFGEKKISSRHGIMAFIFSMLKWSGQKIVLCMSTRPKKDQLQGTAFFLATIWEKDV